MYWLLSLKSGANKMNTKKIAMIAAGLTLPLSLYAWAQSPEKTDEPALAPRAEIRGTYSHPADTSYLYDQIELRIEFADGPNFVLATRPGESIFATVPLGNNREKRMALVLMPAPFGEKAVARQELLEREPASIGFRLLPVCLNRLSDAAITDKTTPASCQARSVDDNEEDFVLPLSGLMQKDIAIGESVEEIATGTTVTVLGYRPSGYTSFQQFNPYAKFCTTSRGVELCSCTVLTSEKEGKVEQETCSVSEEMRAAFKAMPSGVKAGGG
jgi:hypothetical protein